MLTLAYSRPAVDRFAILKIRESCRPSAEAEGPAIIQRRPTLSFVGQGIDGTEMPVGRVSHPNTVRRRGLEV